MKSPAAKAGAVAIAVALLPLVGYIDYVTGYDISVFVLYAFPIAWIAWSVDLTWGMVLVVLAVATWIWADIATAHHYAHPWIRWEKVGMHILTFGFIAFSFSKFRHDLDLKARKVRQLEGILPICIACNRISNAAGEWMDLDTYLRQHSEAKPEPCLCPECSGARFR